MDEDIIASLREGLSSQADDLDIQVEVNGNRALIRVVSSLFDGMSRVRKQQTVYACIDSFIADGRIHAVTIQASAPAEA